MGWTPDLGRAVGSSELGNKRSFPTEMGMGDKRLPRDYSVYKSLAESEG